MKPKQHQGEPANRWGGVHKRSAHLTTMVVAALILTTMLVPGCARRTRIAPDGNQPGVEIDVVEKVMWASVKDKGLTIKVTTNKIDSDFTEVSLAFSNLTKRQFALDPTAVHIVGVTEDTEVQFKTWDRESFIEKTRSDYQNMVHWRDESHQKAVESEKDSKKRQELIENHARQVERDRIDHARRIDYLVNNLLGHTTIDSGAWVQGCVMVAHSDAVKYRVEVPLAQNTYRINFVSVADE